MKDLLYELRIEDDTDEVFAISLVESPAIESDFIYFDKEVVQFAKVDTEQRMLLGPILIPDKKILRVDGEGQPYHVFFTKDTVKKLAQNYLMKKYTDKATIEHAKSVKGVHLVESWVKDGKLDKSNNYGLNLPEGSWVGMFKITDDKIWNDYVKTGKVQGFSIEGLFTHALMKASKIDLEKDIEDLNENEVKILLGQIKALIRKDNRFKSKERVDMESYSDYPDGVKNNAKRALEWADKNGKSKLRELGLLTEAKEGVPHYTEDGKLWEGPTHKGPDGRLMTGEVHTEDSKYLYHREELNNPLIVAPSYAGEPATIKKKQREILTEMMKSDEKLGLYE